MGFALKALERVRRVCDSTWSHRFRSEITVGIAAALLLLTAAVAAWSYLGSSGALEFMPTSTAGDGQTVAEGRAPVSTPAVFTPATIRSGAAVPVRPPLVPLEPPAPTRPARSVAPAPASAAEPAVAAAEGPAQNTASTSSRDPERDPPGIYLIRRDGTRELLEPAIVSQVLNQDGGRTQTAIVSGVQAARRSAQQYQEFDFIFPSGAADIGAAITGQVTSPRQFVLVQMYEEADYEEREMDIVADGISGPDPDVLVPFNFERTAPGVFRVRPTEPLGIGEFCFFNLADANPMAGASLGLAIFDFGIDLQ